MNNTKLVTTQRQNQGDLDYGLNVQGVPNGSQQLNPQRHRNKLSASLYKLWIDKWKSLPVIRLKGGMEDYLRGIFAGGGV
jgi:hypothetical protein